MRDPSREVRRAAPSIRQFFSLIKRLDRARDSFENNILFRWNESEIKIKKKKKEEH